MGSTTLLTMALMLAAPEPDSTLRVDAARVVNRITPLMYGSCIEDVNHEVYGGIYAQMIFGESFEEPPKSTGPVGWSAFGGQWSLEGGTLSVAPDHGAKVVRDEPTVADGTVSCDVRLRDEKGGNAGLIVRVKEPKTGADNWLGYEVSLSVSAHHVMLGRHHNNFKELKEVPAKITAGRWHRLTVRLQGRTLRVYLDDAEEPAIVYTDDEPDAIAEGRVGLRTWGSAADFRKLTIEGAGVKVAEPFESPADDSPARGLSGMWDLVRQGDAVARLAWDEHRPFNSAHSQRLEKAKGDGIVGVANRGLNRWGLTVKAGHPYAGHLYLRQEGYKGPVTVALQSADGRRTYASEELDDVGADWSRFDFTLEPDQTDTNARFAVWVDRPGKVWVDQAYLSPTEGELFRSLPLRADIVRGLQAEGLTLLRYGGCMVNAPEYRWKSMLGDRDRRPQYKGWWYPQSTNGFGIEEFVQLCRAAGFECVFAINVEEDPKDAADLVEYLNGPATSEWGRRRAENGHPEPYGVKYIQIGNEETTNAHYIERFKLLYDAMRPRDPDLNFIVAAWWEPDNPVSRRIVEELGDKAALWDVHVGGDDPREGRKVDALFTRMERLFAEWAPRARMKACVLEENGGQHNVARALGHAGIVNATERHGDFVRMDCPANCLQPWKQNDNDWNQGQLFFTSSLVWGMPPYYTQQMASAAHLPCRVGSEVKSPGDDLDLTATRDEAGTVLTLKVVNAGDRAHVASVAVEGLKSIAPSAEVTTLSGPLDAVNTPDATDRIQPRRATFDGAGENFRYEFPPRSYTVLQLKTVAK